MWSMIFCLVLGAIAVDPRLPSEKRVEIERIDAEIEDLKEKKRGFEGRALRAEDQAERLQFEDRFTLETRQYFKAAEENRQQARLAQEKIDKLEKRKAELLGR